MEKGKGLILGIVGRARVGKDTFAEMLAEEFYQLSKQRFILMAYATELKKKVQRDFNLSYEQLWGNDKEIPDQRYTKPKKGPDDTLVYWTAREILQEYGQFYRTIDGNFWVKHLFQTITEKEYDNVIVTDVRHPNEADPIKKLGGLVMKVSSIRSSKPSIHGENHISETAMDDYRCDMLILNDWGLKELREKAREAALLITELRRQQNG